MSHKSIFVSGWRPATGWVCVIIIFFNYVGIYLLKYLAIMSGWPEAPEPAGMTDLLPVLIGMLGIGGMRTYEKAAGVATTSLRSTQ